MQEDDDEIREELSPSECFGDFWHDIFNLKIMTEEDEKRRKEIEKESKQKELKEQELQENQDVNGGVNTYIRQIILYNLTPKVNLVG